MGITIAYRGRLADLTRIEDFEDRLLDFALEVGGLVQIWRSHADDKPQRVVRGVILNLAPGQEPACLLISPEGWLIGMTDIEDAELGRLTEPPWCFTRTQFGPLEGHVALVEMLAALKREFMPDLEVSDEGGYYPTRDLAALARSRGLLKEAMAGLAEGHQRHGLSREAAEDPDIMLQRIERITAQVHRILQRPAEHPPVAFPDDEISGVTDPAATEALWDEMFKNNRRQQERMQRALEERRARGEDDEQAFEKALADLALDLPDEEDEPEDEPWRAADQDPFAGPLDDEGEPEEAGSEDGDESDDPFAKEERHPLLKEAMDLLKHLHELLGDADPGLEPSLRTLFQGAGDTMGGLAQALSGRAEGEDDPDDYGLHVVQLKRALRGAAFARGALYSLRTGVTDEQFAELQRRLGQMEKDIFQEISRLRSGQRGDEP